MDHDLYAIALGRALAAARENSGISQGAAAMGVSASTRTISRIERGEVLPDAYELRRLLLLFDVKYADVETAIERAIASAGVIISEPLHELVRNGSRGLVIEALDTRIRAELDHRSEL